MSQLPINKHRPRVAIRVMVVDASLSMWGIMASLCNKVSDILLVASASDGDQALEMIRKQPIDIVLLDADMIEGYTILPRLLMVSPNTRIILVLDAANAAMFTSMRATALGASDFIEKPYSPRNADAFADILVEKIYALAIDNLESGPDEKTQNLPPHAGEGKNIVKDKGVSSIKMRRTEKILIPEAIAVGSSTGGPEALIKLFSPLAEHIKYTPIFVTQHLPASFTTMLASHIQDNSGIRCVEPKDGDVVMPGIVYLAPGDHHMELERQKDGTVAVKLTRDPPENFCRPSVNPMLRSLVNVYGSRLMTVILTGMGHDGLDGCKVVAEAGGIIVAQDKESSVVWGMPGAVANAGLCNEVLPLEDIAYYIRNIMRGEL